MSSKRESMRSVSAIALSQRMLTRREALDIRQHIDSIFVGANGYLGGDTRAMFKILDIKDENVRSRKLRAFIFNNFVIRAPITVH